MSEYVVKNLNTNIEQEVRIYRVDKTGVLIPVMNFTSLDQLDTSASIHLKPEYVIDCTGAINFAGIIDITGTGDSQLITQGGTITNVTDSANFIEILHNTFGLEAIELTPYVRPI